MTGDGTDYIINDDTVFSKTFGVNLTLKNEISL